MVRLAVLGANGQVGAELCLLLAQIPEIELVPVCRNRSGSAFLRWKGIACRHGRIAEAAEAPRLIGDCDVVVNCSLATGTPSQIRRAEDRIARNAASHSKPGAALIHFSTQSVYGDPTPGRLIRWRNPYGRAKRSTERTFLAAARDAGKSAFVLRLGHVCGVLQEISNTIRNQITLRAVVLPADDRSSNTVYTAAIVGAIRQIAGGGIQPGVYDLMNTPRWTWLDVYRFEAQALGVELSPTVLPPGRCASWRRAAIGLAGRFAGVLVGSQWVREAGSKLFARVPDRINQRAMAWWYRKRADREIASLLILQEADDHLSWVENGVRFFPAAIPTLELLRTAVPLPQGTPAGAWPSDLTAAADPAPEGAVAAPNS